MYIVYMTGRLVLNNNLLPPTILSCTDENITHDLSITYNTIILVIFYCYIGS